MYEDNHAENEELANAGEGAYLLRDYVFNIMMDDYYNKNSSYGHMIYDINNDLIKYEIEKILVLEAVKSIQ